MNWMGKRVKHYNNFFEKDKELSPSKFRNV